MKPQCAADCAVHTRGAWRDGSGEEIKVDQYAANAQEIAMAGGTTKHHNLVLGMRVSGVAKKWQTAR
jgi:hypothetical protein